MKYVPVETLEKGVKYVQSSGVFIIKIELSIHTVIRRSDVETTSCIYGDVSDISVSIVHY